MTAPSAEALDRELDTIDGKRRSMASLLGTKGTIVVFVAGGCPTARSYEERLKQLHREGAPRGVNFVAINSNNPALSPPDTKAEMVKRAREQHFGFPYLKDENGATAMAFGALCTPHAFLLDEQGRVVYSGRIDDSRMGDRITSRDLANAVEDLVAGRQVRVPVTEPFGCSVVW